MKKFTGIFIIFVVIAIVVYGLFGSQWFKGTINELRGDITGNTYTIDTFDNFGKKVMTVHGTRINVTPNIIKERTYSEGQGWGTVETLSSALTINIDGHQMTSCGDTLIFYEDGLVPIVNFEEEDITSVGKGIESTTFVSGIVNYYKNLFGKPVIVVIKSQTGYPLYAFEGKSAYIDIPDNLPKFTKLTIDGKQLYIHRANYQIIDAELLH